MYRNYWLQTINVLHVIIYWRVVGQSLRDVNLFFCDNWVRKWVRKTVRHKTNWFPKDLFSFSPCYFHYAKIGVSNAGILSQKWVIFQEFVGNAILTGQIKCPRHSNWANWCWRLAIFVSWDTVNGKNPAPVDMRNIPLFIGFHKYQVASRISCINSTVHIVTSTALRYPRGWKDFVGQQDAEDLAGREKWGPVFEICLGELISWKG